KCSLPAHLRLRWLGLLIDCPLLYPLLKRPLAFSGDFAGQEIVHTDVFIQVGSMNPFALPNQAPMIPLLWCAMDKARIPGERDRNRASIRQIHTEGICRDDHLLGFGAMAFNRESRHSSSPIIVNDVPHMAALSTLSTHATPCETLGQGSR